jgi:pSer/pThr/pTyr-binding forkhead associated (FHA) protein
MPSPPPSQSSLSISQIRPGTVNGVPPGGISSIEVSSNAHTVKYLFPLSKPVINIGREPSNDIVIGELVVSGFHAQIVREGNLHVLVHPHPARARTLNGLHYQGRHIAGDQFFRRALDHGDVYGIGDEGKTQITLTFHDGREVQEAPQANHQISQMRR